MNGLILRAREEVCRGGKGQEHEIVNALTIGIAQDVTGLTISREDTGG
jgi:hypothetical protein